MVSTENTVKCSGHCVHTVLTTFSQVIKVKKMPESNEQFKTYVV